MIRKFWRAFKKRRKSAAGSMFYLEEQIKGDIFELYSLSHSHINTTRNIERMMFDAKYQSYKIEGPKSPSDLLEEFYASARKGDRSFVHDPFFRHMRKSKDVESFKLQRLIKKYRHR